MLKRETLFNFGPLSDLGTFGVALMLLLIVWSIVWKGIALWTAAREGHKPWFVVLLVLNTLGILEIVYLLCFSKRGEVFLSRLMRKKETKSASSSPLSPKE